jgi:hypothetical protein
MLPSLACLAPTSTPYERRPAGMSDLQLAYNLEKTLKEANALIAKRKHLDQMSEDALQRYKDYMQSLTDGNHQKDWRAKLDALKAAWDASKERWDEANNAVSDAIQRVVELREELEGRRLPEL